MTPEAFLQYLKRNVLGDVDFDRIAGMNDDDKQQLMLRQIDNMIGMQPGADALGWYFTKFLDDDGKCQTDNPLTGEASTPLSEWLYDMAELGRLLYWHQAFPLELLAPELEYDPFVDEKLNFTIDLYETLSMIDLSIENPFVNHEKTKIDQLISLINLRYRKPQAVDKIEYRLIPWKYGDRYYPLIQKDDGNSTELFSSIYSKTLGLFVEDEADCGEKIMYRVPLVIAEKPEILANLYEYRYDVFLEQINEAEINRITYDQILGRSLVLICVYDINGDEQFLSLAEKLLNRLNAFKQHDYVTLNLLQIKKRKMGLDKDDETILESINSDDIYAMFGKYVLLNDKSAAEAYFAKFPKEEQEKYQQYPIYTLYLRLS